MVELKDSSGRQHDRIVTRALCAPGGVSSVRVGRTDRGTILELRCVDGFLQRTTLVVSYPLISRGDGDRVRCAVLWTA